MRGNFLSLAGSLVAFASFELSCAEGREGRLDLPPPDAGREFRCTGCHMTTFRGADPVHAGVRPVTCHVCHGQESWRPSILLHEGMDLTGKHVETPCFDCHIGASPKFRGTAKTCIGCHAKEDADMNARESWHEHFPDTCADCHQTTAWKPAASEPGFEETPKPLPMTVPTAVPIEKPKPKPRPPRVPPTHPTTVPTIPFTATTVPPEIPTALPTAPTALPTTAPSTPPLHVPDIQTGASRRGRRH